MRNVLTNSVEKHFIADVPVGVMLSGGVDSSIIAGISSVLLGKKINTYSIGYRDAKYKKIDESGIATKTANFIKSNHENILIDYDDFNNLFEEYVGVMDVPSIDGFNTYIISKEISKKVKVVLSGLGGDEMFAGYPVFKELYKLNQNLLIDNLIKYLPSLVKHRIGKQYLTYKSKNVNEILINKRLFSNANEHTIKKLQRKLVKSKDIVDTITLYEIQQYMSNTLLRDSDVLSMASGLEMRMPFVDVEVLKLAMKIPGHTKFHNKINKPVLVDSFKDILLPDVYNAKKRGFSLPIVTWANDVFKIKQNDLLNMFTVFNLKSSYGEQFNEEYLRNKKNDYNKYKWGLLLMWFERNNQYLTN